MKTRHIVSPGPNIFRASHFSSFYKQRLTTSNLRSTRFIHCSTRACFKLVSVTQSRYRGIHSRPSNRSSEGCRELGCCDYAETFTIRWRLDLEDRSITDDPKSLASNYALESPFASKESQTWQANTPLHDGEASRSQNGLETLKIRGPRMSFEQSTGVKTNQGRQTPKKGSPRRNEPSCSRSTRVLASLYRDSQ
jgi:hypothetical protein